jgi:hypothetical protein
MPRVEPHSPRSRATSAATRATAVSTWRITSSASSRSTLYPVRTSTFAPVTPPRKRWSRSRNRWSRWRNGWTRCRETGGHDAVKRVVTITRNSHNTAYRPEAPNARTQLSRAPARSRSLSLSSRPSHPDGVAWTSSAASDEPAQAEKEPPCADLSPPPSGTSQERPTTSRALLCASQASTSDTLRLPCVPEVPGGAAHSSGCAAQRSTCVPPTPTCVPFGATGEGSPFDLRAFRSNDCAASTASRAARA